jgi:2-(3-amino-3-carboxypropyl)histidine synthase
MKSEKLSQLRKKYELDLEKIIKRIKKAGAKSVLLQFPDGLKQYACEFVDFFSEKFPKIKFKIWLGSCYGACDVPNSDAELIIQFGHARWNLR